VDDDRVGVGRFVAEHEVSPVVSAVVQAGKVDREHDQASLGNMSPRRVPGERSLDGRVHSAVVQEVRHRMVKRAGHAIPFDAEDTLTMAVVDE
jgi:hypothetical protein